MTTDELWLTVLGQLQTQMTQATFDSWLSGTSVVDRDGDRLTIDAKSEPAKAWLENRLLSTISRTVKALAGRPLDIQFVVVNSKPEATQANGNGQPAPEPPPVVEQAPLSPRPGSSRGRLLPGSLRDQQRRLLDGQPLRASLWLPYLGQAYDLYQLLANLKRTTVKRVENRWTAPQRHSYSELAKWLNHSHSRHVSGYIYECPCSRKWVEKTGEEIPAFQCCGMGGSASERTVTGAPAAFTGNPGCWSSCTPKDWLPSKKSRLPATGFALTFSRFKPGGSCPF